ncbi:MAG TPA: MMPL family transporter [Planctomycetota bacterium]
MPPAPEARRLALAALAALALILSLVALLGEFADRGATLDQLLPPAEAQAFERASPALARQAEVALVALAGAGTRWADGRVAALERELAALPGVARVEELAEPSREHGSGPRLLRTPELRLLLATLAPGERRLADERALTQQIDALLAAAREPGERAYALGWPRLRTESWALARADLLRVLPLLTLCALALPPLFLGSFAAGLVALIVAAASTALALWGYRLVGGPLSPLALLIVPLLWAVGTMDALHLAGRVRALAARGLDARTAVARARRELAAPCLVTTLTTAIGMAVMGLAGQAGLLRELGLAAGAGVLAAYVVTFGPAGPLFALCARAGAPPRWPTALGLALLRRARARPGRCIAAWGVLALLALAGLPRLAVSSDFPHLFAPRTALARDLAHLAQGLGTDLAPLELIVSATDEHGERPLNLLGAVLALTSELHALPGVRAVYPLDALDPAALGTLTPPARPDEREAELARVLARPELAAWVDPAGGAARLQVHRAPGSFGDHATTLARLAHFDATMLSHHALVPGGPGHAAHRAEALGLHDLVTGALLSALALAATLALALRRARATAAVLVVSTLPLLLVAGAMGLLGVPWSVALLPLPAVLLGIGMDDGIHLCFHPRGRARFDALPAILGTTALVATCVASLAWTSFATNRAFGLLLAGGLLLALAADLTLLPALTRWRARPRA